MTKILLIPEKLSFILCTSKRVLLSFGACDWQRVHGIVQEENPQTSDMVEKVFFPFDAFNIEVEEYTIDGTDPFPQHHRPIIIEFPLFRTKVCYDVAELVDFLVRLQQPVNNSFKAHELEKKHSEL